MSEGEKHKKSTKAKSKTTHEKPEKIQGGFFHLDDDEEEVTLPPVETKEIIWQAPEFINQARTVNWYLALIAATLIFSAALYLLTKDKVSVGVVILSAIIVAVYTSTSSKDVDYKLSNRAIYIKDRHYSYEQFKSFYVSEEGGYLNATLIPMKRFAVSVSLYFRPEMSKEIGEALGQYLPYEERQPDRLDRILRSLKF